MINEKQELRKFCLGNGVNGLYYDDYVKNSYINPMVLEERQMNVTSLDVYSRLLMDRIIFLGTEIDSTMANIISAQLQWLESKSNSPITLEISSNGGSIYDGYKILDTMNYINCEISTICMGMVASMATIIASSGTKGKRFILPHSRFLIHQPMSGISAGTQSSDIQIHAREIDLLKTELTQILTGNTYGKVTYEEMEKMCDRDTILTAQQALEKGFVDEIVASKNFA
jgi:ATP-dependent Clp protease, protease subunit